MVSELYNNILVLGVDGDKYTELKNTIINRINRLNACYLKLNSEEKEKYVMQSKALQVVSRNLKNDDLSCEDVI
jgi:hypothetical protein